MRLALVAAISLATATTAMAGDNGGRCAPKHLAGAWAATIQYIDTTDPLLPKLQGLACSFTVKRNGNLDKDASTCSADPATPTPVDIEGTLSTTRRCHVEGTLTVGGTMTFQLSGQITPDRALVVGSVFDDTAGTFLPLTAVRTSAIRGNRIRY